MKKIPSLFRRDHDVEGAPVRPEIAPGCEWVIAGEGVATRKRDGTACLYRDGRLYKRYDAKRGKQPPAGFEPAQDPDPVTGHWPGWLEVNLENPASEDVWHALAWWQVVAREDWDNLAFKRGTWTYELCGPRLQSNPEKLDTYRFFEHGSELVDIGSQWRDGCARARLGAVAPALNVFECLRAFLETFEHEGIVFWRDSNDLNCDKAKVTRSMLGLPWNAKKGSR